MKECCKQYQESSQYADNVHSTNAAMGYHNMADRANIAKQVQNMPGPKMRAQEMGKPGSGTQSSGKDY